MQFENLPLEKHQSTHSVSSINTVRHTMDADLDEKQATNDNDDPYGFEGCEKRLILYFSGAGDLRDIPKSKWIMVLNAARCAILHTMRNTQCVAHLLSESSLFLFKHKLMIKTCGTTTLLMIVPILIQECKAMQLMIDNVFYSRSNFMFPANQPQLHRSFDNEVTYLNEYFDGYGVVLGSLNQARWHCYHTNHDTKSDGKTLEIVLFDLDDACMEYYFKNALHDVDLDAWIMNGCGM
eukprot:584886_1